MTPGGPGCASGSGPDFRIVEGPPPGWEAFPSRPHDLFPQRTPAMVLSAFVRRWMNGKGFTPPRGRQTAARPARRRPRPHLEALEDRSVPSVLTVTSLADSGHGSLRDAIAGAGNLDTITFDPSLRRGTITLTSGELLLNKNLSIEGPGADSLTVSGGGASRVFEVPQGWSVSLSGLTVADGRVTGAAGFGGAVLN